MAKKARRQARSRQTIKTSGPKFNAGLIYLIVSLVVLAIVAIVVNTQRITKDPNAAVRRTRPMVRTGRSKFIRPKVLDNADDKCRATYPLSTSDPKPMYDPSGDYCFSLGTSCDTSKGTLAKDWSFTCAPLSPCCRQMGANFMRVTNQYAIGDGYCRQATTDSTSTCETSCGSSKSDLGVKCMKNVSGTLKNGKCCGAAAPTSTPTPTPKLKSDRDCGSFHIDCLASFGQATSNNNSSSNYQNPNNYSVRCTNWNGSSTYGCYFMVGNNMTCDGLQFANPTVYYDGSKIESGCLIGIKENSHKLVDGSGNVCSIKFAGVSNAGSGYLQNCKNKMGQGW